MNKIGAVVYLVFALCLSFVLNIILINDVNQNYSMEYLKSYERESIIFVKGFYKGATDTYENKPEYFVLDQYKGMYRIPHCIWAFMRVNHQYMVKVRGDRITGYITTLTDDEAQNKILELRRKLKIAEGKK